MRWRTSPITIRFSSFTSTSSLSFLLSRHLFNPSTLHPTKILSKRKPGAKAKSLRISRFSSQIRSSLQDCLRGSVTGGIHRDEKQCSQIQPQRWQEERKRIRFRLEYLDGRLCGGCFLLLELC